MAQYSVFVTVLAVSVLFAHTLCFSVNPAEEAAVGSIKIDPEARQSPDAVIVQQADASVPTPTTPAPPLPARIRDTILNNLRDFGNNVRQAPARVQECFQNITKCANTILRRNQTVSAFLQEEQPSITSKL